MSGTELALGLIDSGVDGPAGAAVAGSHSFHLDEGGQPVSAEVQPDRLGHGTAMANVILDRAPGIALYNAQVFLDRLSCSARQVAQALDWLVACEVRLVNLSFGLRQDRAPLREACARAIRAGVILIASAPARGEAVYPAAYPQVIRATGDARCAPGEISKLDTEQADFGAYVRFGDSPVAGASVGCAHLSAHCARHLKDNPGATRQQLLDWLAAEACYHGPERRLH